MAEKFCRKSEVTGGKNLEEKFCGVWGQMREEYLRVNNFELYNSLQESGELEGYLRGY